MGNKTIFLPGQVIRTGDSTSTQLRYWPQPVRITAEKPATYVNDVKPQYGDGVLQKQLEQQEEAARLFKQVQKDQTDALRKYEAIRVQEKTPARQPNVPNKIAQADPKWNNKVAWSSKALLERQETLETHSVELENMFDVIRRIAEKACRRALEDADLDFTANFGSPIMATKHTISIQLVAPVSLRIMLTRELVAGRLKWSADISYGDNQPPIGEFGLLDLSKLAEVATEPAQPAMTRREERKARKVNL